MTPCLVMFVLLVSACAMSRRVKRVYNGFPVIGRNVYNSIQYTVWISNSHECAFDIPFIGKISLGKHGCLPEPWALHGTGSLISPNIVQTACHIVATYADATVMHSLSPAIVKDAWEWVSTSFMGWNDVSSFQFGLLSRGYFASPRCGMLWGSRRKLRIIADYGWIVLNGDVLKSWDYHELPINFAPVYTVKHLAQIWESSKAKQLTCMVIGWGFFDDRSKKTSPKLLHGWNVHLSYWECYKRSSPYFPADAKYKFDYGRDATWDCALGIPHFNQSAGNGDSGSPVTCDNQYVGIASWASNHAGMLGYHAPIAFIPYENTIEFRKSFIQTLNSDKHEIVTGIPSPTPWTPKPNRKYFSYHDESLKSFSPEIIPESFTLFFSVLCSCYQIFNAIFI